MVGWDAVKHERMLLLIYENFKIDSKVLSQAWKKKHPNEAGGPPTAGAIDQHTSKFKKAKGSTAAGSVITAPVANSARKPTATPNKPIEPKTPTTSTRRKRDTMSEDDESEPELSRDKLSKELRQRASLSRSSKSAKNYSQDSDGDDEGDEDSDGELGPIEMGASNKTNAANGNDTNQKGHTFDDVFGRRSLFGANGGGRKSATSKKRRVEGPDSADESDISNFSAGIPFQ